MLAIIGQVVAPRPAWSLGEILIAVVIVLALIAVVYVATQAMGIPIPQWFIRIVLICVIAVVAILAIRFLLSL